MFFFFGGGGGARLRIFWGRQGGGGWERECKVKNIGRQGCKTFSCILGTFKVSKCHLSASGYFNFVLQIRLIKDGAMENFVL